MNTYVRCNLFSIVYNLHNMLHNDPHNNYYNTGIGLAH